jgi:hypothetical protein
MEFNPNFTYILSRNFPGGTEENHKKNQSGYRVFRSRFESSTSRIQLYSFTSRPTCSVVLYVKAGGTYSYHSALKDKEFGEPG